jgi:hypothetical protein
MWHTTEQMLREEMDDLLPYIEETIREEKSEMIKVAVMQITDHYYSLAMIQGQRTWMAGAYVKEQNAKAALTRLTRRGGNEYQAVSFEEYQEAVRAIEK